MRRPRRPPHPEAEIFAMNRYTGLASVAGGIIDHAILTRSMPSPETSVAADS